MRPLPRAPQDDEGEVPIGAATEVGAAAGSEDPQARASRRWSGIVSRPTLGGSNAAAGAANGEAAGGDGPAAIDSEGPVG